MGPCPLLRNSSKNTKIITVIIRINVLKTVIFFCAVQASSSNLKRKKAFQIYQTNTISFFYLQNGS